MLLQTIQSDAMAARLAARDATTDAERALQSERAKKLTTLYSEAFMLGKNKSRETTEQETIDTVRKFLNGVNDSLPYLAIRADDESIARLQELQIEKAMWESYLPKEPTEAEVAAVATETLAGLADKGPKAMGVIMEALKTRFGTALNRQVASAIAKQAVADAQVAAKAAEMPAS